MKNQKLTDGLEAMREKFSDAWAKQEQELDETINMMRDGFQIKGEQDLAMINPTSLQVANCVWVIETGKKKCTRRSNKAAPLSWI